MIFKKNYNKREDGKYWNRSAVLRKIILDVDNPDVILQKDTITFKNNPYLQITFITDQYSDEKLLELNGSVMFDIGNELVFWTDVLSIAKIKFGEKYRALSIRKDESWEGSNIQKECEGVYRPFFEICSSTESTRQFLTGQNVRTSAGNFSIPNNEEYNWLHESGNQIAASLM